MRFFEALSQQPLPYIPEEVPVLTAKETDMARSLFSSTAAPCLKCHATGDPQHDKIATAPNFLLAKDRLKPDWVERWIIDPQAVSPGTSMPSGLFRQQNSHWVFSGPTPPSFNGYEGHHRSCWYGLHLPIDPGRAAASGRFHAARQGSDADTLNWSETGGDGIASYRKRWFAVEWPVCEGLTLFVVVDARANTPSRRRATGR